jgi:hypothetical protein
MSVERVSIMSNVDKEIEALQSLRFRHWGWGRERCPSAKKAQTRFKL